MVRAGGVVVDLDWSRQKSDFAGDGSLRDIYVLGTTAGDWTRVLAHLAAGRWRAEYEQDGVPAPLPAAVAETRRDGSSLLRFWVGDVGLCCHFFAVEEIEFDFVPNQVDEAALRQLLAFLVDLGDVTGKSVVLTPENDQDSPLFRYVPGRDRVEWLPR